MAYVLIEGYLCERCGYRWAPRTGTGLREKTDPKVCSRCKSPYWNKARKNRRAQEKRAIQWDRGVRQEPVAA